MIRISQAITEILEGNPLLQLGLSHQLLNLTQTAQYLKHFIETRTKKKVQVPALVMALSRLQKDLQKRPYIQTDFAIENLSIHSDLCDLTYIKSSQLTRKLLTVYPKLHNNNAFLSISESTTEITIITERHFQNEIITMIGEKPSILLSDISAIGIKFHPRYIEFPGMIYLLVQQVTLQNINIVEIASTGTELIIFVNKADTKLAFDTLFNLFYGQINSNGHKT